MKKALSFAALACMLAMVVVVGAMSAAYHGEEARKEEEALLTAAGWEEAYVNGDLSRVEIKDGRGFIHNPIASSVTDFVNTYPNCQVAFVSTTVESRLRTIALYIVKSDACPSIVEETPIWEYGILSIR